MRRDDHRDFMDEKGILLLGALFFSTLTMLMVTVGLARTFTEMRAATLNLRKTQDFHMAEAAMDYGLVEARRQVLALGQFPPQLQVIDPPALPPSIAGHYTLSNYQVSFADIQPREVTIGTSIPELRPYQGMKALVRDLRIHVDLEGPTGLWTHLESVSQFHLIPIYQFAEFDWNDWTFTPGPEMSITGPIHANGSIALGPDTGLTIDGAVTASEELLHILPGTGYVKIKGSDGNYHDMRNTDGSWLESIDLPSGMADIASRWGGQVKARAPVITLPMPTDASGNPIEPVTLIQSYNASDTAELRKAKLFYQADLRIQNGNQIDANGNILGPMLDGVSTTTFYDAREQQTMCVTDVDIAALQSRNLIPDPDGNERVLYVESTQSACKNGVRIKNGAELNSPLTIVTHNPLYVVGDYNVGNLIHGTTKQPASLMADAVTVLSSAWDDAKSTYSTSRRVATSTTLNAALMTSRAWQLESDTPAQPLVDPYLEHRAASEHMIRFLENWDGQMFTFTGSEVSPWDSHEATPNLACCGDGGAYNAPRRVWAFDQSFLTSNKLPPGTPKIHAVVIGSWRECAGSPCQ